MNWSYKGKDFTETPEHYGFIYCITYTNGKKYIGQKQFNSVTTLAAKLDGELRPNAVRVVKRRPLTKDQMDNRTKAQIRTNVTSGLMPFDKITKPSKWQKYEGSSKNTADLVIAFKEILTLVPTKRLHFYYECKALFIEEAIESDAYLNDNILNKFHRGNLFPKD